MHIKALVLRLLHLLLVYLNDSLAIIVDIMLFTISTVMSCSKYMINIHVTIYGSYHKA